MSKPEQITLSSDSDDDRKPSTTKLKPSPSKSKSAVKKKAPKVEDDSDFEMDEEPVKTKAGSAKKRKIEASSSESDGPSKPAARAIAGGAGSKKATPVKKKKAVEDESSSEEETKPSVKGKAKASASSVKPPPAKKAKVEPKTEDGEQKPKSTWWAAKARAGPANPDSKEVPVGNENCLAGLTFVFTGELESLSREAGSDLVKRYGGRVTTAPSSKTSYVVLGSDAGPKKLEMIKKHNIKTLTEDGLLELIGSRPSGANDPKFIEQKKKEEQKIKEDAKKIKLDANAPEHKQQLWTVKYAPTKYTEICGNKGAVEKLDRWVAAWPKALLSGFKKPGPDAMGAFRCVLISGPPGIGKTTAAHLVAKQNGYDVLELNASDVRSKKLLESAFQSKITDTTLSGFFKEDREGSSKLGINRKSLIIMDEVDGMSAGDRGGVGALNALIKKTKVPIIAICNDKSTPKMKPLAHTTYQMPFRRPTPQEIRSRMMTLAFKEGMKVEGKVIDQLVAGSQSDIRQVVNMLSAWKLSARALDFDEGKKLAKMNEKNTIQTPWSLYSKLFAPSSFSTVSALSLNEKQELYFQDHSAMPLFVQENYLKTKFARANGLHGPELQLKNLELVAKASEAISDGDLIDRMIHGGEQHWSLMPVHGMFSCVRPAFQCYGPSSGYPSFPAWFGKNSTQGKLQRLLGEIQIHMRLKVSGDRREIRQSYLPTLFEKLVKPIQEQGTPAVEGVIELMDEYYLTKEDWDALVELGVGEGYDMEGVLKAVSTQTKSAFTRMYNKGEHPVPFYKAEAGKPSKKLAASGPAPDLEDAFVEEEELAEEDDEADGDGNADGDEGSEADLSKDKLIRNKAAGSGAAGKKAPAKPRAKAVPKAKK